MALSFVAQSARGRAPPVPQVEVESRQHARRALPAALARRGRPAARPRNRRLLDLRGRARHQRLDVHRARRRLDRGRRAPRRCRPRSARCRARSTAARRRASCRCSTRSQATGDAEAWVRAALDRGERLMGFGHRVYRAEDPRARVLRRTARAIDCAAASRSPRSSSRRRSRSSRRATRADARHQRRVLVGGRARLRRRSAGALHADVRRAREPPAGRRTSSSRSARDA